MMKISALNEAPRARPEIDDEDTQSITNEAQEQIALTEYNRALELLKCGNIQEALMIFKDLLETELLDQVEKPDAPDGRSRPMLSLKYSCFKNIGAIQASLENYEDAIDNYCEAAHLDGTDVTIWYRIGCLAVTISNLELACSAFKQGLKCNPHHWPCLDNIISVLYAVPDYMNCLLFISMALERDPSYVKGLAFREKIFREVPYFEESYKMYNADWALDPPIDVEFDRILGEKMLLEAKEIARKWVNACKFEFEHKTLPILPLNKPLVECTWLELGESLVDMHNWMAENSYNFVSRVALEFQRPDDQGSRLSSVEDINTDDVEDIEMTEVSETGSIGAKIDMEMENSEIDSKQETEIEEMDAMDNSDDQRVPNADFKSGDKSEADDDAKSRSSDMQLIEDDEQSKITKTTRGLSDNRSEHRLKPSAGALQPQEVIMIGDDEETDAIEKSVIEVINCEKSNEEPADKSNAASSDKGSVKLNDKSSDKSFKNEDKSKDRSEGKEEGQKVKKRRRSSLCFLQQWAWSANSSMRRSARVRGSNRRETERDDVQLEDTLRRMFPSSLLPDGVKLTKDDPFKNDDSMDTMDLYQLFANRENNLNEGSKSSESSKPNSPEIIELVKYFGSESEKVDVEDFINEHTGKSNLMIIVAKYTEFLSTKWNHEWPKEMGQVYLQAYSFTREHVPHPSPFGDDEDNGILKYDAEMTLLFGELHTDRWMDNKPDVLPKSNLDRLGTGMPSEELGHIIFASVRDDLYNEENTIYLLRVLWLKANIFHCQGDTDIVLETLELLLTHMEEFQRRQTPLMIVNLPNCKYNSRITIPVIQKMLRAIRRGQKLGEVQRLYDEKKYSELAATLQDTFKFARQRQKLVPHIKVTIDRIDQLAMLLDSLWKLEQYEECYVWAEACLNESWQNYINANEESEQRKWSSSVVKCLEIIDACVSEVSTFVVRYLPETRLARLVQNLVQMVCHQLDVTENAVEMPLETVLPWIILHYVLQYEEDKGRAKALSNKSKDNSSDIEDQNEDIPTSIMILLTAHEFLGRHAWCCANDAKLLVFTMKLVIPRLRTPQFYSVRDKLVKHFEQIFYCLYGHSNKEKKAKTKFGGNIEEHNVPHIELTWEGAQLLFDFYRPDNLPEYDSPRAVSINPDTHSLFKKITSLVPEEHNPSSMIDEVTAYIVGDRDTMPTVKKPLPYQVASVYALLGDYLHKYNQYSNSTKYFLMDLCLHPEAFNSWAALAMVVSTEFGTALTNCKPLPDTKKLLFDAKIAQSCYQRAVELVPAQSVIWIEYGNFAYTVHSFCSRLLKQETDTLSMEKFEALENRKEETLEIAVNCFISANRIFLTNIDDTASVHDERWLYHYMLAKIAEKKNEDPTVYLDHYAKASDWLHKNHAQYPSEVPYKNPSGLSVEALEIHYRIHACILKYLEQHEGKPLKKSLGQSFLNHLLDCVNSPFMQFASKLSRTDPLESNGYPKVVFTENLVSGIPKSRTNQEQRFNSVEEIPAPDKPEPSKPPKSETRKRQTEIQQEDSRKRIKLGSVSHLQMMQDVVSVVENLLTSVLDNETNRDGSGDEVVIVSSDEGEKTPTIREDSRKRERGKNSSEETTSNLAQRKVSEILSAEAKAGENVQDMMDVLMKRAMEISNQTQSPPRDDEDTRKSDGKWLVNDDVQSVEGRSNAAKQDKDTTKDKVIEKKKNPVNTVKDEITLSRRGSQESTTTTHTTTTTTTETNNSSSSSSDESSSSEDSSESDSSSDSDSESAESEVDRKKTVQETSEKEEYFTETEVGKLIAYCLAGLEQCVLRFPEHYKSIYRLCHYFFNNKAAKDNTKCRDLLLRTYACQYYDGRTFNGLFADRKSINFFHGVWRNPIEEIDRPGSFASHMSRCVTLLMQILKETDDSWMLMELCVQLRKIPEADKKYLRDSEREQLARQAQTLCVQSLRTRIQNLPAPSNVDENLQHFRADPRKQVLLDVYKIYREVQKTFQGKDSTIQVFATLLTDGYKAYTGLKNVEGNILDIALKYCHQTNKITAAASNSIPTTSIAPQRATSSSPVTLPQPQNLPTSPQTQPIRKPYKSSTSTGRPRGRPSNSTKLMQSAMAQMGVLPGHYNAKSNYNKYLDVSNNRSLMNPYFMMDPNVLSAALLAGSLGSNIMDPLAAASYFNPVGTYQDIMRQYQSNLSSMTSLAAAGFANMATSLPNSVSNVPTMSTSSAGSVSTAGNLGNLNAMGNLGNLTVQQLRNLGNSVASTTRPSSIYHQSNAKTTTTTSTTKEVPSISITPVGSNLQQQQQQQHKSKAPKHSSTHIDPMSAHLSKSMQLSQATVKPVVHQQESQISLLKPSVIQQAKIAPPKQMSAPQIRVSKSLTEPQPAHNSSQISHSVLAGGNSVANQGNVPQAAHITLPGGPLSMTPSLSMGLPVSRGGGTSLQHKLQSKKMAQQPLLPPKSQSNPSTKKHKTPKNNVPQLSNPLQGLLNTIGFMPPELSGISVSPVGQSVQKPAATSKHSSFRKNTNKSKSTTLDMQQGTIQQTPLAASSTAETLSMLTQLQQHSHLEIIPQQKIHNKQSQVDYSKNPPVSLSVVAPQKVTEIIRPTSSDCMSVFELPRNKPNNNPPKKADNKHAKESVEIITLDD